MLDVYVIGHWVDEEGSHDIGEKLTFPDEPEGDDEPTPEHLKLGYLLHNNLVSKDRADVEKAKKMRTNPEPVSGDVAPTKKTHTRARAAKKQS